jgi:hypothetical protein
MPDCKHNPFESPTCSIAEAILWVAYRDVARIRDEPSLFSLHQWPDAVTKGHWLLLRELAREQRTIVSFDCTFSAPFTPAYYRGAWSNLKDAEAAIGRMTLRFDENRARQILGLEGMEGVHFDTRTFGDFIKTVETVLGFIYIDTDSLTQTFPVPDFRPAPATRKRRSKVKRRQIQIALALRKHKLEKSPKSDAALAPVLEKKESSLGKVAPSTLFVVRRDFKELIEQAGEHEPN